MHHESLFGVHKVVQWKWRSPHMGKTRRKHNARSGGAQGTQDQLQNGAPPGEATKKSNKSRKGAKSKRRCPSIGSTLAALGLKLQPVEADGNCFFRSLEDQLCGNRPGTTAKTRGSDDGLSLSHSALRRRVVDYVKSNRDAFEPFVEDDEPFDDYVERMARDGAWAGHLEVQAASLVLHRNIVLHQAGEPAWVVNNFPGTKAPALHLAYTDGMHYDSVRLVEDDGTGLPLPIPMDILTSSPSFRSADEEGESSADARPPGGCFEEDVLLQVQQGSGVWDRDQAQEALENAHGDVDAAIEALIAALSGDGFRHGVLSSTGQRARVEAPGGGDDSVLKLDEILVGGGAGGEEDSVDMLTPVVRVLFELSRGGKGRKVALKFVVDGVEIDLPRGKAAKAKIKKSRHDNGKDKGGPSRNSRCPCGSTKKYKNCCGAVNSSGGASRGDAGVDKELAATASALKALYL